MLRLSIAGHWRRYGRRSVVSPDKKGDPHTLRVRVGRRNGPDSALAGLVARGSYLGGDFLDDRDGHFFAGAEGGGGDGVAVESDLGGIF